MVQTQISDGWEHTCRCLKDCVQRENTGAPRLGTRKELDFDAKFIASRRTARDPEWVEQRKEGRVGGDEVRDMGRNKTGKASQANVRVEFVLFY